MVPTIQLNISLAPRLCAGARRNFSGTRVNPTVRECTHKLEPLDHTTTPKYGLFWNLYSYSQDIDRLTLTI